MNYIEILTEKKDHIGFITLNRPEHLNTFTELLATELNNALLDMDNDQEIRVIVIKGAGRAFCAGINVNDIAGKNPLEYYKWVDLMGKMTQTIASMNKPVIASVHKIAAANGVGIVAAADLAIAAEKTKFGTTAVKVGLFCMGPAVALSRNIGRKKALEMVLTGELIDALEAEKIGLINKVVPEDKLEEETLKFAQRIADLSPMAVQLGKKSFYKMADLEYFKALEMVNNHFAILCTTEDAHEGVNAFLNKRQPKWKLR